MIKNYNYLSGAQGNYGLITHVIRVSQRSAECRVFSPGAPVSFHSESWQGGLE